MEKYISFITQKRNRANNEFEKDFNKFLINAFFGKTMKNVRNRIKVEIIRKDDSDKNIKQQYKLTFNGIHKSYEKYDGYTMKQIEVKMDKPIYPGFGALELSKLLMYGTYYDKLNQILDKEIFNFFIWLLTVSY